MIAKETNVESTAYALASYSNPYYLDRRRVDKGNNLRTAQKYTSGIKGVDLPRKRNAKLKAAFANFLFQKSEKQNRLKKQSLRVNHLGIWRRWYYSPPACASFDLSKN